MTVEIRHATPADSAAIGRVHVESWRTTYAGMLPAEALAELAVSDRVAFWTSVLADASHGVIVAVEAGEVVGFGSAGPSRTPAPEYSRELYALYLLATHQRRGIGRQLMRAIAEHLVRAGTGGLIVWVLRENPAGTFYASMGGIRVDTKTVVDFGVELIEDAYGWSDPRELLGR